MNTGKGKIRDKKKSASTSTAAVTSAEPIISGYDGASLLTLDDIIRGGEAPRFSAAEVPSLTKGGKPGKVLHKEPSAGLMMYIQGVAEKKIKLSNYEELDLFTRALADLLVKPDGSPMFTLEDAKRIPPARISEILFSVMFGMVPESMRSAVLEKVAEIEEGTGEEGEWEGSNGEGAEGNVKGEAMASPADGAASPTDSHDSSASAT